MTVLIFTFLCIIAAVGCGIQADLIDCRWVQKSKQSATWGIFASCFACATSVLLAVHVQQTSWRTLERGSLVFIMFILSLHWLWSERCRYISAR